MRCEEMRGEVTSRAEEKGLAEKTKGERGIHEERRDELRQDEARQDECSSKSDVSEL